MQIKKAIELTKEEINIYLSDSNEEFEGKLLKILFGDLEVKLRENKFPLPLNTGDMDVDDGGSGFGQIGLIINSKIASYLQWIFIGYYFSEEFRGIKFLKKNVPEIVLFFDIEVEYSDEILKDKDFCKKLNGLKKYGFENILTKKSNNQECPLFYKRKSITDFEMLNEAAISEFIEKALSEICSVGLNEHKYFKELGI
ncbi:MAG: hypothetical protein LBT84_04305 [Spirochaetia bacterium]|jgi:hypothetical protein|nr:hypothetical protein [Spirochaetia bacterium]